MFDKILGLFTYEVDELVLADGPARDNEDSGEDLRQLRGSHLLVFTSRRAVSFFPRGPIYRENLLGLPLSGSSHHSSEFFRFSAWKGQRSPVATLRSPRTAKSGKVDPSVTSPGPHLNDRHVYDCRCDMVPGEIAEVGGSAWEPRVGSFRGCCKAKNGEHLRSLSKTGHCQVYVDMTCIHDVWNTLPVQKLLLESSHHCILDYLTKK